MKKSFLWMLVVQCDPVFVCAYWSRLFSPSVLRFLHRSFFWPPPLAPLVLAPVPVWCCCALVSNSIRHRPDFNFFLRHFFHADFSQTDQADLIFVSYLLVSRSSSQILLRVFDLEASIARCSLVFLSCIQFRSAAGVLSNFCFLPCS
jgi:hypothetical protein